MRTPAPWGARATCHSGTRPIRARWRHRPAARSGVGDVRAAVIPARSVGRVGCRGAVAWPHENWTPSWCVRGACSPSARAARRSASELKAERIAAADPGRAAPRRAAVPEASQTTARWRPTSAGPALDRRHAATMAKGARRQAERDSR